MKIASVMRAFPRADRINQRVITSDGHTVDAVSESMPVEVGQAVRVVQVRGHAVVVRPVDEEQAAQAPVDPLKRTYDEPFDLPPA